MTTPITEITQYANPRRASRAIQIRRGTAAEHATFAGAPGEITMDTTTNTLRVHDGATPGGTPLARQSDIDAADYVIETYRAPDGSAWYRRYKSGWIEQGGRNITQFVTLPIPMADTTYSIYMTGICQAQDNNVFVFGYRDITTTGFTCQGNIISGKCNSISANTGTKYWRVAGFAA